MEILRVVLPVHTIPFCHMDGGYPLQIIPYPKSIYLVSYSKQILYLAEASPCFGQTLGQPELMFFNGQVPSFCLASQHSFLQSLGQGSQLFGQVGGVATWLVATFSSFEADASFLHPVTNTILKRNKPNMTPRMTNFLFIWFSLIIFIFVFHLYHLLSMRS